MIGVLTDLKLIFLNKQQLFKYYLRSTWYCKSISWVLVPEKKGGGGGMMTTATHFGFFKGAVDF